MKHRPLWFTCVVCGELYDYLAEHTQSTFRHCAECQGHLEERAGLELRWVEDETERPRGTGPVPTSSQYAADLPF